MSRAGGAEESVDNISLVEGNTMRRKNAREFTPIVLASVMFPLACDVRPHRVLL